MGNLTVYFFTFFLIFVDIFCIEYTKKMFHSLKGYEFLDRVDKKGVESFPIRICTARAMQRIEEARAT